MIHWFQKVNLAFFLEIIDIYGKKSYKDKEDEDDKGYEDNNNKEEEEQEQHKLNFWKIENFY